MSTPTDDDNNKGVDLTQYPRLNKTTIDKSEKGDPSDEPKGPKVYRKLDLGKVGGWDVQFLSRHASETEKFRVIATKTGKVMITNPKFKDTYDFDSEVKVLKMTAKQIRSVLAMKNREYKYWVQDTVRPGAGEELEKHFNTIRLNILERIRGILFYGSVRKSEFSTSEPGMFHALRYYSTNVIRYQVSGKRKIVIFCPTAYACLHPYPIMHPAHMYSQVHDHMQNGTRPQGFSKYTCVRQAKAFTFELLPGDLLCFPKGWWVYEYPSQDHVSTVILQCLDETPKALPDDTFSQAFESMICEQLGILEAHKFWSCIDNGEMPTIGTNVEGMNKLLKQADYFIENSYQSRSSTLLREIAEDRFANLSIKDKRLQHILSGSKEPYEKDKDKEDVDHINRVTLMNWVSKGASKK